MLLEGVLISISTYPSVLLGVALLPSELEQELFPYKVILSPIRVPLALMVGAESWKEKDVGVLKEESENDDLLFDVPLFAVI